LELYVRLSIGDCLTCAWRGLPLQLLAKAT